jgi:hypothetical protein
MVVGRSVIQAWKHAGLNELKITLPIAGERNFLRLAAL